MLACCCTAPCHGAVRGLHGLSDRLVDGVEGRGLLLHSVLTVFVLMGKTRAVARSPLAFRALSTLWCLTSGACPGSLSSRRKGRPAPGCSRHRDRCWPCRVVPWRPIALPWPWGQGGLGASCSLSNVVGRISTETLAEHSTSTPLRHLPLFNSQRTVGRAPRPGGRRRSRCRPHSGDRRASDAKWCQRRPSARACLCQRTAHPGTHARPHFRAGSVTARISNGR